MSADGASGAGGTGAGGGPSVAVVAEQLRRRVPGGIGRYAAGLLRGLRDLGADAPPVTVVASRHRGPGPDPLARYGFSVVASSLPGPLLVAGWDRGWFPVRVPADVVHAVSLAAPPPGRGPRARPLVVTVHDLAWRADPAATTRRGRRWHEAALGRALDRAAALVAPSQAVADALAAAGAPRVEVIPHGLDHLPGPDAEGARALLGRLGVAGPYLLAVGTLEPRKNLRRLIESYARARGELPEPWPLVVVGPAGWGDSGLDATPGVLAAGGVSDPVLAGLYATARALAYVPLSEGFGLPPLEAMAMGLPVLTSTAVPSAAPSPPSPPAALRVDPGTTDAIVAGLVRVATDDVCRGELVAAGHRLVAPMTWAGSAARHVALWTSLRPGGGR